jgi:hypothetical protein
MSTDVAVVILSSALPLLGVLIGSGSTIFIQRISARESRLQTEAERRQARRAEIKNAIDSYLKIAQHLQTQLYTREHGGEVSDVPVIVEQVWLAHAHVDVICSEKLRVPLTEHATALNEVARHGDEYADWWGYVLPYKMALHDAIRKELRWQDDETFIEPRLSSIRDQAISERNPNPTESESRNTEIEQ